MSKLKMHFYPLETERLHLREIQLSDAADLFAIRSDASVNLFLDRPGAGDIDDVLSFIGKIRQTIAQNEGFYWVITLKGISKVIGTVCYWNIVPEENKAEIGYELLPDCQGKGMMQEALAAVIRFGWEELQLNTIEAWPKTANEKSIELLKKFKFTAVPEPDGEYTVYRLKQDLS